MTDEPKGRRQVVKFSFFRVDPAWRALPAAERDAHKAAFAEAVERFADRLQVRSYSVVGMRGDADFLLWQIGDRLDVGVPPDGAVAWPPFARDVNEDVPLERLERGGLRDPEIDRCPQVGDVFLADHVIGFIPGALRVPDAGHRHDSLVDRALHELRDDIRREPERGHPSDRVGARLRDARPFDVVMGLVRAAYAELNAVGVVEFSADDEEAGARVVVRALDRTRRPVRAAIGAGWFRS